MSDPNPDDPYWTSLGLEGELVLAFEHAIQNNNGDAADLRVYDADDDDKGATDSAAVYASFDGVDWVRVGTVSHTGDVDLGSLAAAHYVKVVDTTRGRLVSAADGCDLDAVEVLTGCADPLMTDGPPSAPEGGPSPLEQEVGTAPRLGAGLGWTPW